MSEQEKAGDTSPPRASRHLDAPVRRWITKPFPRWQMILYMALLWFIGHWMGCFYGMTRELYESRKAHGEIPQDMTWQQFLEQK